MKIQNMFISTLLITGVIACGTTNESEVAENDAAANEMSQEANVVFGTYGEEIDVDEAIMPMELMLEMEGHDSLNVTLVAEINSSCKKKGCWMNVDLGNEEEMTVRFIDYGFFVPKEGIEGKTAFMRGTVKRDTTSVELLQHYAEDGGATQEEIDEITEPEYSLTFLADGVVIHNAE